MTRLAYIVSSSFSGSTLLTFLLAGHSDIATVGELKGQALGDVDKYDCSCGVRIRTCPFWCELQKRLCDRGVQFSLDDFGTHFRVRHLPALDRVMRARVRGRCLEAVRRAVLAAWPAAAAFVRDTVSRNAQIIQTIMAMRSAPVFLDGSKDPVRAEYLRRSGLFDMTLIRMVRDGRGNSCSYMKHHGLDMTAAATEWRETYRESQRLYDQFENDRRLTIRYEDLCDDPAATVHRVTDMLGLERQPIVADFRSVDQHIVGNAMRLASSSQIHLDQKWRDALTGDDLNAFERVAGALNRRLGYQDQQPQSHAVTAQ